MASAKQVEALLAVSKGWHRIGAGQYPSSSEELASQAGKVSKEEMFLPSVESQSALRDIDRILSLDGLRAIFVACTDFAEQLGHPLDYEHPDVWAALDGIVKKAHSRGITVVANTGYAYKSREAIIRRVKNLYDHGVRVVMIQNIEFLLEAFSVDLLKGIRELMT